jgi:hypothetical protein
MVTISLDSPSCEVTLLILYSVVYRDVTRQAKGLYRLKHVGALRNGLAYLSRYNSGWFCHRPHFASSTSSPLDHRRHHSAAVLLAVISHLRRPTKALRPVLLHFLTRAPLECRASHSVHRRRSTSPSSRRFASSWPSPSSPPALHLRVEAS